MSDTFKKGDIVMLKSGGPNMTVTEVEKDFSDEMAVYCKWFNEKGELKEGNFPPETVHKIS